jgi:hypothetical protein
MPKAARISSSISAPNVVSKEFRAAGRQVDTHQLVSVALFSGIGLLISLVAVILGVQGAWF